GPRRYQCSAGRFRFDRNRAADRTTESLGPAAEKGPATFDVTHVFTASVIQLLRLERVSFLRPLGKTLTSGWQFLNVTTLMTGAPFSVYSGVQQTDAGLGGADR